MKNHQEDVGKQKNYIRIEIKMVRIKLGYIGKHLIEIIPRKDWPKPESVETIRRDY